MRQVKRHVMAVTFFLILTVVFMGPVVLNPSRVLYGNPGVPFVAIWWGWWCQYSNANGLNYLHPCLQGAPFGADYSHYPIQPMRWLYDKLFLFLNEVAAYNLIIFIGFFTSALSAYILAYFITQQVRASIVAGLIFSFSPFHLMQLTKHLWLATTQWIPLYFLLLLLLFIETFHGGKRRTYVPFLCAVFFALVLFENYYYGYMAFLLTVLVFLLHIFWLGFNRRMKDFQIRPWIIFCFSCALLILPFMVSIWTNLQAANRGLICSDDYIRSMHELNIYGTRWFHYFIPPFSHPLWGKTVKEWLCSPITTENWGEKTLFIGVVPLFLAGYAVYRSWKGKTKDLMKRKIVFFFLVIVFLAFILSFQGYLNVAGIKFPFASQFLHQVFPMFRAYARFGIFVILGLSILAALGVKELNTKGGHWHFLSMPILVSLIIFEFINFPPYPVTRTDKIPQVYKWLRDQPGQQIIVEYPLAEWDTPTHYQYLLWQRYHQKPFLNGVRPGTTGYQDFREAKTLNPKSVNILSRLGIKYIIINRKLCAEENSSSMQEKCYSDITKKEIPSLSSKLSLIQIFDQHLVYEIVH